MPAPATPLLAVDVIVVLADRPGAPVVLIERGHPPRGWALPGGFVEVGETLAEAARREVREETGLRVALEALLGCYSAPDRDPRGHTVSAVFVGRARGEPAGGDDARRAAAFPLDGLPAPLAFDHALILADYRHYRATGERPPPGR